MAMFNSELLVITRGYRWLTQKPQGCWPTKLGQYLELPSVNIEKNVENPPFVDHFPQQTMDCPHLFLCLQIEVRRYGDVGTVKTSTQRRLPFAVGTFFWGD